MSDPFSASSVGETRESPFAAAQLIREAVHEAGTHVFEDAKTMMGAAVSVHQQSKIARKTGDVRWLRRLQGHAGELALLAGDFVRQAIVIAAAKFVLELCAMVINSVMDAITKRGKQHIDISNPNVRYVPTGQTQQGNSSQNAGRSQEYVNPFATSYGGAASPW